MQRRQHWKQFLNETERHGIDCRDSITCADLCSLEYGKMIILLWIEKTKVTSEKEWSKTNFEQAVLIPVFSELQKQISLTELFVLVGLSNLLICNKF